MICSFGAILAWKSDEDDAAADADADDDYDDDYKSDPYMSPSYAGDTKKVSMRIFKSFFPNDTYVLVWFLWSENCRS